MLWSHISFRLWSKHSTCQPEVTTTTTCKRAHKALNLKDLQISACRLRSGQARSHVSEALEGLNPKALNFARALADTLASGSDSELNI